MAAAQQMLMVLQFQQHWYWQERCCLPVKTVRDFSVTTAVAQCYHPVGSTAGSIRQRLKIIQPSYAALLAHHQFPHQRCGNAASASGNLQRDS